MNKSGKGPNLTWIFIGLSFAVAAITLSMTSYDQFLSDNGVSVSDDFNAIYGNISSQSSSLDSINSEASEGNNWWTTVTTLGDGTLNVFVTGLASIGAFFQMGTIASSLLSTTKTAIPGLDVLFGLLISISVLFIVMSLIKARRGLSDTA